MASSRFFVALFITSLLAIVFSHGFGRKMAEAFEDVLSTVPFGGTEGESRKIMTEDYEINPGPNTNTRSGFLINPPSHSHVSSIAPSPHGFPNAFPPLG